MAPDPTNHPGPIDNTRLFKETTSEENGVDEAKSQSVKTEIRDHMIDDLDYVVVPQEGWTLLVETFGATAGQEPVERKVVEHGMFVKHCKVEVYKVEFLLAENDNPDKTVKKRFSKADTLCKYLVYNFNDKKSCCFGVEQGGKFSLGSKWPLANLYMHAKAEAECNQDFQP